MHKIDDNLYVCVPCANLATQIHPIEKSDDDDDDDDDREGKTVQFKYIIHNITYYKYKLY